MGTVVWNGDATAVAHVANASIDSVDGTPANNTFTVTIDGLAISQVGDTDVATTAAALVVLLNASTYAQFAEVTWTNPSAGNITGTADTAGVPFTATLTETGAGTGAVTDFSDTTASAGPNDWSTAANWDTGAVPVDDDDVVIENSAIPIYYGLDQSAVELGSLRIEPTFTATGGIGLPRTNASGYVEYRRTALKLSATTAVIDGSGTGRINIEWDTDDKTACTINGTGTAAETGVPPILLSGGHADNTLNVNKGTVAVGYYAGETATLTTADVGYITNQGSDATVSFGSGVTLGTLTTRGGTTTAECNTTTATNSGGTLDIAGAATSGTLNNRGGTVYYTSTGTCTTLNASTGSVTDFRRNSSGRTVTNANVYSGAAIYDPAASVTWTNGLDLRECGFQDVALDLGDHLTWTPSAIV